MLQTNKNLRNAYALAFGLPVLGMLVVMIISGSEPFGNLSMLYSDMYHQYYPFWVAFRDALRSGESLLYTWSVGMGMDYLSLISYYLASPLNLLSILVPESLTLEFYSLLMPIKLGLASLFFAIFLNRLFEREDLSIAFFGTLYALCAWALGFQWNIMWLDSFALLPLVALGTVYLLRDRKFILYTLTLFLSIFSNYYIGFFVCIFVFLLFFCYQICRWEGFGKFFRDLFRIAFFSLLAIGMTAVLELPALAGLQNTQSSVNQFPTSFRLNIASENTIMGLLDAMRQVAGNMCGGVDVNFKEGLPNIYCGIGTAILSFLFLTSRDVKLRDKICCVFLLLFFNVSFIIRQLDYIWHGFHFTNMIPYRFSFLYCFVMLYMAYRAYILRFSFKLWQILTGAFGYLMLMFASDVWNPLFTEGADKQDAWIFLAYNAGFLIVYLATLLSALPGKAPGEEADQETMDEYHLATAKKRRKAALYLCVIVILEMAANVANFALRFSYTTASNYPKGTDDTKAAIEFMEQREQGNLFYRVETTHSQTLNDGALNGYMGVTTFTSSANVKVTEFMRALGYGAKNTYNRYCFEESSPVANLFLGLKYMIERDGNVEENDYFNLVFTSGKVNLLENNAYLPLGFMAHPELAGLDFSIADHFDLQNALFSMATGINENVWVRARSLDITGENVEITNSSSSSGTCNYTDAKSNGTVTYTFTAQKNGFMCIDLNVTDRNSYTVYLNGDQLYTESLSLPQMIAVSNVGAGDEVQVVLKCKSGEEGRMTIKGAILDGSIFQVGYEELSASTLEIKNFSSTSIDGTVNCLKDGLLYTSIPQDGNWKVFVDGVQVEHVLVGDAMIGIMMTAGEHNVSFRYENEAFSYGWKITLLCAMVFLICVLVSKRPRKTGKFEK